MRAFRAIFAIVFFLGAPFIARAQTNGSGDVCLEWNSFLAPVFNIQENSDFGGSGARLETSVYNLLGEKQDSLQYSIPPRGQRDLIISDLSGYASDSYGLTCTRTISGAEGDARSRMLIYKLAAGTNWSDGNYQFAYALEPEPRTGTQYVFYNTYQPSLAERDQGNFVANWIQISNPVRIANGPEQLTGKLYFYSQKGELISVSPVTIPSGGRSDISGHDVGRFKVGVVKWKPDDPNLLFQLRNVRYVYDNNTLEPSFDTAFQLPGEVGKSGEVSVPVETTEGSSVLEIGNLSEVYRSSVNVKIFDANGLVVASYNNTLSTHEAWHIVLDGVLNKKSGLAIISGSNVLAVSMQYIRKSDGGVFAMYGLRAEEAKSGVLTGSYNLFLEQDSQLLLGNRGSESSALVSVSRYDGSIVLNKQPFNISANGLKRISLSDFELPDTYGVVTVEGDNLAAWLLRKRGKDFAIPLRVELTEAKENIPIPMEVISGEKLVNECENIGTGNQPCAWRYQYEKGGCENKGCKKLVVFFAGGEMGCGIEGQSGNYDEVLNEYAGDGFVAVCAQIFKNALPTGQYTFAAESARVDKLISSITNSPEITSVWDGSELLFSGISHGATAPVIAMARTSYDSSNQAWSGTAKTAACFFDGIYDANAELAFIEQNNCTGPTTSEPLNFNRQTSRYCGAPTLCSDYSERSAEDTIVNVSPTNYHIRDWKLIACGSGNLVDWPPCTWDVAANPPISELCSNINDGVDHRCEFLDLPLPLYNHYNCSVERVNECRLWFDSLETD